MFWTGTTTPMFYCREHEKRASRVEPFEPYDLSYGGRVTPRSGHL